LEVVDSIQLPSAFIITTYSEVNVSKFLGVSYDSSEIGLFSIDEETGKISELANLNISTHFTVISNARPSPNLDSLYVSSEGEDKLMTFSVDVVNNNITVHQSDVSLNGYRQPTGIGVAPNGKINY